MAPVLNEQQFFILENPMDFSLSEQEEYESKQTVSVWVKDKDVIRASTDISLLQKIEPGVYAVDFSRDMGLFCKKIDIKSDELFIFSDSITQELLEEINLFWSKAELYKANNLIHKRGILLEGFPGTGKSSIISILSNEIIAKGGVVFKINGFRNLDHYIEFVRTGFRKIQPDTPIITILEDLDQYEDVEVELLDFLDGKTHLDHHVIIATTNNTEIIPDTFLRPSRIDLKVEIPLPNEITRREYFTHKEVPENDIEELVSKSNNFSLADLKELYICIYLLDYTIDEAINKISSPREKKNYLHSPVNKVKLGL
jgi:hypothetical protein